MERQGQGALPVSYTHLQTAYTIASVAYWLFGGFLGLRFLRDYVLNYLYTTNTKQLQVCRVYGPGRPRVMEDVYFSRLKAIGEVERCV